MHHHAGLLALASWLKYVPYQNLCVAVGICGFVLWVGVQTAWVTNGKLMGPRQECRARLDDWFQGQLEGNGARVSRGLKTGFAKRRSWVCSPLQDRGCLPRRSQVLFVTARDGAYARSWTEVTDAEIGVLPEQIDLPPSAAAPYFRPGQPSTAVCVAQLDEDAELDVWSVSVEARVLSKGQPVRRGELWHEHDDLPPEPEPAWRWW